MTFVVLGLGRHGATVSVEPPTVGRVHRTRRRVKSLRTNCTSELTKEVSRFSDSESETVSRICRLLRPQAAGWILALEVADVTYYSRETVSTLNSAQNNLYVRKFVCLSEIKQFNQESS